MPLDDFWRATPRIVNLVIEAYHRRRAWAAFHAGYGTAGTIREPKLENLLGKPARPPSSADEMLARLDRFAARHNARIAPPSND